MEIGTSSVGAQGRKGSGNLEELEEKFMFRLHLYRERARCSTLKERSRSKNLWVFCSEEVAGKFGRRCFSEPGL